MEEKERWHFLNLYRMAIADGDFDAEERRILFEIAEKKDIEPETLNELIFSASTSSYVPTTIKEKISILYDLMKIAWADGKIDPAEKKLLAHFVEKFDFNVNGIDELISYFHTKIQNNATIDDIINEINAEP